MSKHEHILRTLRVQEERRRNLSIVPGRELDGKNIIGHIRSWCDKGINMGSSLSSNACEFLSTSSSFPVYVQLVTRSTCPGQGTSGLVGRDRVGKE